MTQVVGPKAFTGLTEDDIDVLWKWLGYVDKFILFIPSLARHVRWADVVHVTDHSNGMYIPWVNSKPNVITCHDVIAVLDDLRLLRCAPHHLREPLFRLPDLPRSHPM